MSHLFYLPNKYSRLFVCAHFTYNICWVIVKIYLSTLSSAYFKHKISRENATDATQTNSCQNVYLLIWQVDTNRIFICNIPYLTDEPNDKTSPRTFRKKKIAEKKLTLSNSIWIIWRHHLMVPEYTTKQLYSCLSQRKKSIVIVSSSSSTAAAPYTGWTLQQCTAYRRAHSHHTQL